MTKLWTTVGWTYEADHHCLDCGAERFAAQALADGEAVDGEGNEVTPLLVEHVSNMRYETINIEREPWLGLPCGTCHEIIDGTGE